MSEFQKCQGCHKLKPKIQIFVDRIGARVCESCYMERTKLNPKSQGNTMPLKERRIWK